MPPSPRTSPQPAQPAPQLPATPAEIEILIGRLTAMAVAGLAAAVRYWQRDGDAGAGSDTRLAAGNGIAQLVMLREAVAGEIPDFEATARTHGLRLLQARCGDNVSADLLASLIDDVLRLVDRVVRTQWH
jgi:hypothetical protein